jgi:DNA-binding MarR family transcriptional regulator
MSQRRASTLSNDRRTATERRGDQTVRLGGALSRAWVGYHRRLDTELAARGFADHGFPDGRVLRICKASSEVTISQIGRDLGITRQGASKLVASLRDRHYVTLSRSPTDRREKRVKLTPRAVAYLAARRRAARRIERQVRLQLGADTFQSLHLLLRVLGGDEQPRIRDYIRNTTAVEGLH